MAVVEFSGRREAGCVCAFCNRRDAEVGTMIRGPQTAICDECVARCAELLGYPLAEPADGAETAATDDLLEAEARADSTNDDGLLGGTPVRCVLCTLPKDPREIVIVPDRGALCTVCVDAIRAATDA
jgi:hypothetical protein